MSSGKIGSSENDNETLLWLRLADKGRVQHEAAGGRMEMGETQDKVLRHWQVTSAADIISRQPSLNESHLSARSLTRSPRKS